MVIERERNDVMLFLLCNFLFKIPNPASVSLAGFGYSSQQNLCTKILTFVDFDAMDCGDKTYY